LIDVRRTQWYPRYLSQITTMINDLAGKKAFKTKGGRIRLLGVEGDLEHGAATRAEWTALIEDIDRGCREGSISVRPQSLRLALDEVEEALEWCEKSDEIRHIIFASCPAQIGDDRTIMSQVRGMSAEHDRVHVFFASADDYVESIYTARHHKSQMVADSSASEAEELSWLQTMFGAQSPRRAAEKMAAEKAAAEKALAEEVQRREALERIAAKAAAEKAAKEKAAAEQATSVPSVSNAEIDAFFKKVRTSLEEVKSATSLNWSGESLTDSDCKVIAHIIASGAMAQLQKLFLHENHIGDAGVTALAEACAGGAMASLQTLVMDDGPLGVDHPKLKAACQERGITLR